MLEDRARSADEEALSMSERSTARRRRRWLVAAALVVLVGSIAIASWALLHSGGGERSYPAQVRAGPFSLGAVLDPNPPRQRGDHLHLRVRKNGQPVEDARIDVAYVMPAMGAMPEMRGRASVQDQGEGRYDATFDLPMGGSWTLEVDVRAGGEHGRADFGLTVGVQGLTAAGSAAEQAPGTVVIPGERRQAFGITSAPVRRRELDRSIRAVGMVTYDPARLHDVELRAGGWVETVRVTDPGEHVERGQVLFTLYSPELYSAEVDYVTARGNPATRAARGPARRRLRLLGMSDAQIRQLVHRGEPSSRIPILSPVTGWVVENEVIEGVKLAPGARAYRIADLSRIRIEAEVYEADLPLMEVGQTVEVTVPYLPGRKGIARVSFVYPYVDPDTRTGTVRAVVDNAELALLPNMYANLTLAVSLGRVLAVPVSAVIYTGLRRIVFVDEGEGRLVPREIEVGVRTGDDYVVQSGLREGEIVVTSGNFLVASESRLRSSSYWRERDAGAGRASPPRHEGTGGATRHARR